MNRVGQRLFWAQAVAVLAILGLAGWLRLSRLDLVEFRNDESWALLLTENMVRLGQVQLVGLTTSLNIHNPPDFLYVLAPVVELTRDPRAATAAVGLANLAGVGGVVALGWRSFSPLAGLVAGLAYAANPWAVLYGRKVWAQDVLAPVAVLFFVALEQAVIARRTGWATAALPIFAVGVELHFSFGVLAPLLAAPIGLLVVHRHWKHLVLGVGLAVLSSAPYVVFNYLHDWADLHMLLAVIRLPAVFDGNGPGYVFGLLTSWDYWFVPDAIHLDRVLPGRVAAVAANLQTTLLVCGFGLAVVLTFFRHGAECRALRLRLGGLLLWALLPAVLTVRHAVPLYAHYYILVLPVGGLLIGAGVRWLAQQPARWGRPVLGLALCSLLTIAAIHTAIVVRLLDHLAISPEPSYGLPLVSTEAIVADVANFGVTTGARHLVVELWDTDCQPLAYVARPFFPTLELVNAGQVGLGLRLGDTPAPPPSHVLGPNHLLELRYADGVQVLNSATSSHVVPSERASLAIVWTSTGPLPPATSDAVWEVSLYNPQGDQVTRRSGIRHDLAAIAPGETLISWFMLATESIAAPGQYELGLRRLDSATGQPLPFVDSVGQAGVESRFGPIDVH